MEEKCDVMRKKEYYELYYNLLMSWKFAEQEGRKLTDKLREMHVKKIAVYGMGKVGWLVCNEILQSDIELAYAIDKNAERLAYNAFSDIPDVFLFTPDDELGEVDAVIVTAVNSFNEIEEFLKPKINGQIISLKDIIDYL
ncbi:MAG: hypothetical protein NC489_14240 [Ruminococcus flavefaciens]|nr:hypothetical protein [Ruminococcus flavefaciens]